MSHITGKQKKDKLRRSLAATLALLQQEQAAKDRDYSELSRAERHSKLQNSRSNQCRRIAKLKRQADYLSRKLAALEVPDDPGRGA